LSEMGLQPMSRPVRFLPHRMSRIGTLAVAARD
jgi:hypothetical protein